MGLKNCRRLIPSFEFSHICLGVVLCVKAHVIMLNRETW